MTSITSLGNMKLKISYFYKIETMYFINSKYFLLHMFHIVNIKGIFLGIGILVLNLL